MIKTIIKNAYLEIGLREVKIKKADIIPIAANTK